MNKSFLLVLGSIVFFYGFPLIPYFPYILMGIFCLVMVWQLREENRLMDDLLTAPTLDPQSLM